VVVFVAAVEEIAVAFTVCATVAVYAAVLELSSVVCRCCCFISCRNC
jgi:hypothetical protein